MGCGGHSYYPNYERPMREEYPRSNYSNINTSHVNNRKSENAVDILKRRLVNAEITEEQYREMLRIITEEVKIPSSSQPKQGPVKPKPIAILMNSENQSNGNKGNKPIVSLKKNK
ncbi:hypothetical protein [Tepidibacillus marianensis]|uniref:hypothetical protein n=1 Tax=Tepidibacillus marianensis TaxID=3131995 RepID=UPI0030D39D57